MDGVRLGAPDGLRVGVELVGTDDGLKEGEDVVGATEGLRVGTNDGVDVG